MSPTKSGSAYLPWGFLSTVAGLLAGVMSTSTDVKAEENDGEKNPLSGSEISSVKTYTGGVWTIHEHVQTWSDSIPMTSIFHDIPGFCANVPYVKPLLKDLWSLGPMLVTIYATAHILTSVLPTWRLAQTSSFLHMIETIVATQEVSSSQVAWVVVRQLMSTTVSWLSFESRMWSRRVLEQRYRYLCNQRIVAVQMRLDFPTSERPDVKAKLSSTTGKQAWEAFEKLIDFIGLVLGVLSTCGFVLGTMFHQPGGRTIVVLCILRPLISALIEQKGWNKVFYAAITNGAFMRLNELFAFSSGGPKQDMLSNMMGDYVLKEYTQARTELGDALDGYPDSLHYTRFDPWALAADIASDFAPVALGLKMMANPGTIPLTSLAVLHQTRNTLNYAIQNLIQSGGSIAQAFNGVQTMYDLESIVNDIKDGQEPYPSEGSSNTKGMEIELRDVVFRYPRTSKNVLDRLSFKIPAGSICVIVGENGCGKSSTLKILNRLYDVDEGEILVDGKPIQSYKIADLRGSSAFMNQNYQHYKFTIAENIGLGNVDCVSDRDAIKEASRLGGAQKFIEELPEGYDSKIGPRFGQTRTSGHIPSGSALDVMVKGFGDPAKDFSGGETQRLALSRTFMRSTTRDVKLVAYDEPSAALDPKAEFALFEKLRDLRDGKTMLFITHRLGHLNKYADIIIYMEEGKAVEKGSHDELLALGGKYASLYNVQAQAFS